VLTKRPSSWEGAAHQLRFERGHAVGDGAPGRPAPGNLELLPPRDFSRLTLRLRLPLLVAAIGLSFLSWVTTPLQASAGALPDDLTNGKVARVTLDCSPAPDNGLTLWVNLGGPGESAAAGRQVCWVNRSGLSYVADLRQHATISQWRIGLGGDQQPDVAATVSSTAKAADPGTVLSGSQGLTSVVRDVAMVLGLLLLVGLVLALVGGPQPRRLTKWGTFWVLLIPGGLGVAWWLCCDAPWNRNLQRLPEPLPRWRGDVGGFVQRHGGWTGFAALVVCSLVVGYSADIAASWIGAEQDRGGVWQVVPAGGGEPVEVDLDR
jgi:hypothetical protein